ncbi:MAG: hypothetical protein JKY48_13430 [Flavobacteriales bacterium]|nr:hypothetical protein [Flavobacteriales bacterium]
MANKTGNSCNLTHENILDQMVEHGIKTKSFSKPFWNKNFPSSQLKMAVGVNLAALSNRLKKELSGSFPKKAQTQSNNLGLMKTKISLIGIELKASRDRYLKLILSVSIEIDWNDISQKISTKIRIPHISMNRLEVNSYKQDNDLLYEVKLNFHNRQWNKYFEKAYNFLPEGVKSFITNTLTENLEFVIHTMKIPKELEIPDFMGKKLKINLPIPDASHLAFTTNKKYNSLVLGWTEGLNTPMRDYEVKSISKAVHTENRLFKVVISPYFMYGEIVNVLKSYFKEYFHTPKASTVLIGGDNTYGISLTEQKVTNAYLKQVTMLFAHVNNGLGVMAKVEGTSYSVNFETGVCVDIKVNNPHLSNPTKVAVVVNMGYLKLHLKFWQVLLLPVFVFIITLIIMTLLVGNPTRKMVKKIAEAIRKVSDIENMSFNMDFELELPDKLANHARLVDFSAMPIPNRIPYINKNTYWITAGFDEAK